MRRLLIVSFLLALLAYSGTGASTTSAESGRLSVSSTKPFWTQGQNVRICYSNVAFKSVQFRIWHANGETGLISWDWPDHTKRTRFISLGSDTCETISGIAQYVGQNCITIDQYDEVDPVLPSDSSMSCYMVTSPLPPSFAASIGTIDWNKAMEADLWLVLSKPGADRNLASCINTIVEQGRSRHWSGLKTAVDCVEISVPLFEFIGKKLFG